jgi:meso-butanediol dehydrogenase/(S,S)-butanediol dehydrogenase/diacetyl reductase
MNDLRGKVAVVTGAGRRGGLGEAIVRRLARDGIDIVLSDIGAAQDAATPGSMIGAHHEMEILAQEIAASPKPNSERSTFGSITRASATS